MVTHMFVLPSALTQTGKILSSWAVATIRPVGFAQITSLPKWAVSILDLPIISQSWIAARAAREKQTISIKNQALHLTHVCKRLSTIKASKLLSIAPKHKTNISARISNSAETCIATGTQANQRLYKMGVKMIRIGSSILIPGLQHALFSRSVRSHLANALRDVWHRSGALGCSLRMIRRIRCRATSIRKQGLRWTMMLGRGTIATLLASPISNDFMKKQDKISVHAHTRSNMRQTSLLSNSARIEPAPTALIATSASWSTTSSPAKSQAHAPTNWQNGQITLSSNSAKAWLTKDAHCTWTSASRTSTSHHQRLKARAHIGTLRGHPLPWSSTACSWSLPSAGTNFAKSLATTASTLE